MRNQIPVHVFNRNGESVLTNAMLVARNEALQAENKRLKQLVERMAMRERDQNPKPEIAAAIH